MDDFEKPSFLNRLIGDRELTHSERFAILLWIVITTLILFLCLIFDIRIVYTFNQYPAFIGLLFTPFIFFILLFVPYSKIEKQRFGFSSKQFYGIIGLEVVIVLLSFTTPFVWFSNPIPFLLGFLLPALVLIYANKTPRASLGIKTRKTDLILVFSLCPLYAILVFFLTGWTELSTSLQYYSPDFIETALAQLPIAILVSIPSILFIAAIPEEFMFRALIQESLSEHTDDARSVLITSLIFGLSHIPSNYFLYSYYLSPLDPNLLYYAILMAFLCQAQIGLVFGVAWQRTKSLWLPVILHTIHNVVDMAPVFLMVISGSM